MFCALVAFLFAVEHKKNCIVKNDILSHHGDKAGVIKGRDLTNYVYASFTYEKLKVKK
jgi:hypothetical protein